MAVNVVNLLQGPVEVLHAVTGAVEPANAAAAPAVAWADIGGTDGGVTATLQQNYSPMMVDQVAMKVDARLQEQIAGVTMNAAEVTIQNLQRALNLAVVDLATKLEWGGDSVVNASPLFSAIMLRGEAPGGGPRLVIMRRTLAGGEIGMAFQKDAKTMLPLSWDAYYISQSIRSVVIDDTPGP